MNKIKRQFPLLKNKNFIYLDNATTTHKPITVIRSEIKFYANYYASSHRSIYSLSNNITILIEKIRNKIAKFLNIYSFKEIIFVKGCTEAINLIVNSWAINNLKKGDNIIISQMEHHANIIPWILLSKKNKIKIKICPITIDGKLDLVKLTKLLDEKTKLVTISYVSNVLGTINPIQKIINIIKKYNNQIITIIDGAQAYCLTDNVVNFDCDFYCFSAHKMYGPTGIGILYGKKHLLEKMLPWQGGGGIVNYLKLNNKQILQFKQSPWKFEPGTLHLSGIIGLEAAINFIENITLKTFVQHEKKLTKYLLDKLLSLKFIKIYGITKLNELNNRRGIISFNIKNKHTYDVANLLDSYGIAIRTGHLCCLPLMQYYNVDSMCRVSLSIYNNKKDIDFFINKLIHINNLLK